MSTIADRLRAAAVDDATNVLRAAEAADINDDLALVRSHAAVTQALSRLLWVLDEEEPDVAAQVAAEDGVRSIGIPAQRTAVAA